jgi:sigma-E factor negative regulatory protein RseC
MIEEQARIIAVEPGFAWVETQRQSSCGQCNARSGCGTTVLSKVLGNKMARIRALNPQDEFQTGQQVVVGIAEGAFLRGALFVYMVPVLAMLVGASLPLLFNVASDGVAIVGGAIGLLLGLRWVKRFSQRIADDQSYQAVVLRTVDLDLPLNFKPLK